jgi:hypothetical protein
MREELAEYEKEISELSKKIDRLKYLYDQYFMGFEKMEPSVLRSQIDRHIKYSKLHGLTRPVLRLKFLNEVQRYRTLCAYFDRVLRDINNGSNVRDAFFKTVRVAKPDEHPQEIKQPPAQLKTDAMQPAKDEIKKPVIKDEAKALASLSVSEEEKFFRLFNEYMEAKKKYKDPVSNLSYDRFRQSIINSRNEQQKKHGDVEVDFSVTVKDGKVTLVAKTKKINK